MNNFNKISPRVRIAVCTGMLSLISGFEAFAQNANIGSEILDASADAMKSIVTNLVKVLQIALGVGALVTLVLVVFNILKGEREAAQKIGWWVVGLALGFALISVVANQITRI